VDQKGKTRKARKILMRKLLGKCHLKHCRENRQILLIRMWKADGTGTVSFLVIVADLMVLNFQALIPGSENLVTGTWMDDI
jgi:hypothetical protein